MVDQASVRIGQGLHAEGNRPLGPNGTGQANGGVVGSITEFGNDIFNLCELQAKLAALDAKEAASLATPPLVAVAVGLVLAVSAVPVALLGAADLLARTFQIAPGWAMLATASIALAVGGAVLWIFSKKLTASLTTFRRSQEEFTRNLSWIRTVVLYSGRTFSRPKR